MRFSKITDCLSRDTRVQGVFKSCLKDARLTYIFGNNIPERFSDCGNFWTVMLRQYQDGFLVNFLYKHIIYLTENITVHRQKSFCKLSVYFWTCKIISQQCTLRFFRAVQTHSRYVCKSVPLYQEIFTSTPAVWNINIFIAFFDILYNILIHFYTHAFII